MRDHVAVGHADRFARFVGALAKGNQILKRARRQPVAGFLPMKANEVPAPRRGLMRRTGAVDRRAWLALLLRDARLERLMDVVDMHGAVGELLRGLRRRSANRGVH